MGFLIDTNVVAELRKGPRCNAGENGDGVAFLTVLPQAEGVTQLCAYLDRLGETECVQFGEIGLAVI